MSIISKIGIDRIMGYFFLTITIGKSGNYCIILNLLYYCNHIANEQEKRWDGLGSRQMLKYGTIGDNCLSRKKIYSLEKIWMMAWHGFDI